MQLSHKEITQRWNRIRHAEKKHMRNALLLLAAVFVLSLCFRTVTPQFIPRYTAVNLAEALRLGFSQLIGSSHYLQRTEIIQTFPYYAENVIRFKISLITVFSGMALGIAGAVFQQVYHNPIASPSTIGATAGVNLGNMIVVMAFSASALHMVVVRYTLCLVLTGAIMAVVLIVGKILGRQGNTYSVLEMLMFGSVISRLITSFITYYMYHFSGTAFIAYQQLSLGIYQIFNYKTILIFFIIMAAGLTPLLKMRFRMNAVALDPMEAGASGIRLWPEQVFSQCLGAALVAAACIQCGDVGIFALVIPHIVRYAVGSDFRKLAVYSTIYGGVFLLIIRIVSSVIFLGDEGMPLNFIVSIVMIPVFLVMLAMQRRGFE